jgi:TRAP-type C4-dicarboxylate transport system permease small subunit
MHIALPIGKSSVIMDAENKKVKKLKLRKKLLAIRDILIIMLAVFFIIIGFMYAVDNADVAGEGLKNIRYGLFSLALLLSATMLIITVYNKKKK